MAKTSNKNRTVLMIALLINLLCTTTFAQSIDTYLVMAAEKNPGLKAKYAVFEAEMQQAAQVSSLPDPVLSMGIFISPVETRVGPQRARISLTQMFPWFGTLAARKNIAAISAQSHYYDFINARNRLFYQVKMAWFSMYSVEREFQLQEENATILASLKQLALTRFQNGKGKMVDAVRVDLMIETVQTNIQLLRSRRIPLVRQFNLLLNRELDAEVVFPDSLDDLDMPNLSRTDGFGSDHPLVKAVDQNLMAAEMQEELAKMEGLPTFGLGLSYISVARRNDMEIPGNGKDALMPSISIGLPIYRKKHKAKVREIELSQDALRASKEELANQLLSKYEMALYELEKANELVILYRKLVVTTKQAQELILIEYGQSGEGFEEVLRMQQDLISFQVSEAKSLEKSHSALAHLDFLTAKAELHEE